jgi:hypothetical protein
MRHLPVFAGAASLILFACTSNEIGNSKDVNPDRIYFDYRITGEEGNDDITVMLQYRFGGANGPTLVLESPGKVELDGEEIGVDSSGMTGAFYEITKSVKSFTGKHVIVFTDNHKTKYKEEFSFQPVTLTTPVPESVGRSDLIFQLEGLEPKDYVRVLLTDTSFASDGINRVDTVRDGQIIISKKDLEKVVNGPVRLELYKEVERPVKNGTEEGGLLSITYGLRRGFTLKDVPKP